MMKQLSRTSSIALLLIVVAPQIGQAQAADPKGIEFFEQKIRPVLAQHCYSCHSDEARTAKKLKAKLYLDSAEGMLDGGESGSVIVKGKGAESLLDKALKYDGLEMPPTGKLSDEVIADFVKWIDMGAPDPREGRKPGSAKREINIEEGRQFWSFKPLQTIAPPDVKNVEWSRTPIDRFVAAKHDEKQLKPNGPVSKEKLIRRAYFDLIGLPPPPEQVDAFVKDSSPSAFEKVVDEMLQSERYGERWGGIGSTSRGSRKVAAMNSMAFGLERTTIAIGSFARSTATCPSPSSCGCRSPATSSCRTIIAARRRRGSWSRGRIPVRSRRRRSSESDTTSSTT